VLDVAVRHGWGSDDAFTRAFRAWHGITPSQARLAGAVLRSQPRVAFTLAVEGADTMHHRIVTTAPFRLVGRHARLPLVHEGENTSIADHDAATAPEVAERALAWADVPGLPGLLSVCSGFDEGRADGSSFDYHRAVATTRPAADLPDDLDVLEVPATTFVAFTAEGTASDGGLTRAVQQLWADAYGRWFPANAYRTVDGPEILRLEVDHETGTGRGELWLPVEPETRP
jgi:AraC family transcriptional regulator